MKTKFIIFLLLYCAASLCAQTLTIGSYNLRNKNDWDTSNGNGWNQRLPYICGLIRTNFFDIIGTQEVLNSQLNDLLKGLPEYNYIGVARDDGKTQGEYAAIFYRKSRLKLLENGNFWLSEITDRPNKGWDASLPRICTWGKFQEIKNKKHFWFFNLHMDHIGIEARKESAKLILKKIKEMCDDDIVILTGDFNVDQHSDSYKLLHNSNLLNDSHEVADIRYAPNGTFNDFNPTLFTESRIDHIFVTAPVKVKSYSVLTDTYRVPVAENNKNLKSGNFPKEVSLKQYEIRVPSYHYPVKVLIDIAKNNKKKAH